MSAANTTRPDMPGVKPKKTLSQRLVTIPKAVIVTVVFFIVWLASNSSLPSCNSANGVVNSLNGQACLERQSYLHIWSGWLAILFLILVVVLVAIRYGADLLRAAKGNNSSGTQA
jgi:hypothetical protein